MSAKLATNDLEAFWMPFTANREYKKAPRLIVSAERTRYTTNDGRSVLDGTSGLWCVNAGHCRPKIVEAVRKQVGELDFAGTFQMGHPRAFECASKLVNIAPPGFDQVFFTNSGSESVETALKIALAYHRANGNGTKVRLIGRERGYHGVNFGGISVGGIVNNRKMFGTLLTGVDHLRHTHDLAQNAFTRGEPEHGAELADELERIVTLHDASTIAAVIVEPVAGSTGVLIPPKGYLQAPARDQRQARHPADLRRGHHRLRPPRHAVRAPTISASSPDIMITAKGITNGTIPMGAVFVKSEIHDAFMTGPEHVIELFHGYTYSGNPVACAAGLATLETYKEEGLLTRGGRARAVLGGRAAFAQGPAARHRHPQYRPDRRHRAGADRRRADQARLLGLPEAFERGPPDPHHRRHHRAVAAADHREEPDRPAHRYFGGRAEERELRC